jgi:hypothetical protein
MKDQSDNWAANLQRVEKKKERKSQKTFSVKRKRESGKRCPTEVQRKRNTNSAAKKRQLLHDVKQT